jgi:hypothetical protein
MCNMYKSGSKQKKRIGYSWSCFFKYNVSFNASLLILHFSILQVFAKGYLNFNPQYLDKQKIKIKSHNNSSDDVPLE